MAALPANVIEARNAAQQASATAGQVGAMEPAISDVLKQKITQLYADNQDIVKPLDVATTGYLGAPAEAREKYQNIFNPFARENLVSKYQGNKALPMLSLANIYGNRMGRIEDTMGAGVRAFQAEVAAKQAQANQLQQVYTNLLNEYQLTKPVSSWLDLGNQQVLVDEGGNILQAYKKGKVPGTTSETPTPIPTPTSTVGVEPEPMYTPATGVGAVSPGGDWMFTDFGWESTWEEIE